MKISIVTVTWNDWHQLDAWRNHVQTYRNVLEHHVIVLLEPEPAYLKALKQYFPEAELIKVDQNTGTTGGFNYGIRKLLQTDTEFIGLLIQDMSIKGGVIQDVCKTLSRDTTLGVLSPVQLRGGTKDEIEGCGGSYDLHRMDVKTGLLAGKKASDLNEELIEVDFAAGGCNFARAELYRHVGLQDERLFMYDDEVDFAIRVHQAGFRIAILPQSWFWHEHIQIGTGRAPVVTYLVNRNRLLMKRWYAEQKWYVMSAIRWLVTLVPKALQLTLKSGWIYGWASALGTWHGLIGRTGRPPEFLLEDYRKRQIISRKSQKL